LTHSTIAQTTKLSNEKDDRTLCSTSKGNGQSFRHSGLRPEVLESSSSSYFRCYLPAVLASTASSDVAVMVYRSLCISIIPFVFVHGTVLIGTAANKIKFLIIKFVRFLDVVMNDE
jgi:hypothetical protein